MLRDLGGRGGMAALVDAAEKIAAPSVIYGAGLENQPDLVARLASGRTLLGCTRETLERVRDPATLGRLPARGRPRLPVDVRRRRRTAAGRALPPLAAQAGARRRRTGRSRVARRGAGRRRGGAGAHLGTRVLGGGGRRRALGRPARRQRAADRAPRARRARLRVVRKPRAAAARGGGASARWPSRRGRSARIWRRRSNCAGCSAWTSCGTASAPGSSRSTPVRRGRSNASRRRTRWASSPPTWTVAPGACPRSLPLQAAPGGRQGDPVRHPRRARRRHPRLAGARHPRRAHPRERIAAGHPVCTLVSVQESPEAVLADLEARAAALRVELGERAGLRRSPDGPMLRRS